MGNNLSVKITADIVDLQTKFAVAKAEVSGLTAEMNKLARASAAGVIDSAGTARLQQLAGDLIAARTQAGQYAGALAQAGVSTGSLTRAIEGSHGSVSTATREFRALFDELSSGRTRMTPGTLAIIGQRVLGLQASTLVAAGGVAALVAGIGYLAVRAIEAANALDAIGVTAKFAGNVDLTRQKIQQFTDELSRASNVSSSDAREIVAAFAGMHDLTAPEMTALTSIVSDFATATGEKAAKAAEQLVKVFSEKETAASFARTIGGVTQEQLNNAEAADKNGNAQAIFAAKLAVLNTALDRARGAIDQHNAKMTASVSNFIGYIGAMEQGISAEEMETDILADQNRVREQQAALIAKVAGEMRAASANPEQTLKLGVSTAEKENPISQQIDEAKAKIAEMNAALDVARQHGDQVSVDKLNAGLQTANERLSQLQFGPMVERMRTEMAQLAATWDGTQSGLLTKQREIAAASLAEAGSNTKEHLAIVQEMGRLDVEIRRTTGQEIIANARTEIADLGAAEGTGALQRLEATRDAWQQVLASDKLTASQRGEVQRSLNQTLSEIARQTAAQDDAIRRSDAAADIAIDRMKVEAAKQTLDEEVAAGKVSAAQKLATLQQLTDAEYQLDLQALNNELATLKNQPAEYERVYNQIRQLKAKLELDLATLGRQGAADAAREAKADATSWKSAVGEIESAESTMVGDLISKRRSLSQSLEQIGLQLLTKEIANDLKAMTTRMLLYKQGDASQRATEEGGFAYHQIIEMMKARATKAAQQQQTAATDAGNAAREASDATAATESQAAQMAVDGPAIEASAAKTFGGVYSAIAGIPYVGPFIAPAMAAAAESEVIGKLSSLDTGTLFVPQDMTARIHKGESVLPVPFAQGLRQAVSSGGAAGNPAPVNIKLPGRTSGNMFTANIDDLKDALNLLVRKQGGTPVFR